MIKSDLLKAISNFTAVTSTTQSKKINQQKSLQDLPTDVNIFFHDRDESSYSEKTKNALSVLGMREDTKPVGSYRYDQVFHYAGDIDVFERVVECCSREEAAKHIAQNLQRIAYDISILEKQTNMFWVELKCGIDTRLTIHGIGVSNLIEGINKSECVRFSVDGYDSKLAKSQVFDLLQKKLISTKNAEEFERLLVPKNKLTATIYQKLLALQKKILALRWSKSEVILGSKKLPANGGNISLKKALLIPALTKLDTVFWNDDRFIMLEGIYYLEYKGCEDIIEFSKVSHPSMSTNRSLEHVLSCHAKPDILSMPLQDYYLTVSQSLNEYLIDENYSKAIKRFWVLLRRTVQGEIHFHTKEEGVYYMKLIAPVFMKSKMAVFSRLAADVESWECIFNYSLSCDYSIDRDILLAIKEKIQRHLFSMQKLINQHGTTKEKAIFYDFQTRLSKEKNHENAREILSDMYVYFKERSNVYAIDFITKNNLLDVMMNWCPVGDIFFEKKIKTI